MEYKGKKLLTDREWREIEHIFPPKKHGRGRSALCPRLVFEAFVWLCVSNEVLRKLPEEFGNWKSIHSKLGKLSDQGDLWKALARVRDSIGARFTVDWSKARFLCRYETMDRWQVRPFPPGDLLLRSEWDSVSHIFRGKSSVPERIWTLKATIWKFWSGSNWTRLPLSFGNRNTISRRYYEWRDQGRLLKAFLILGPMFERRSHNDFPWISEHVLRQVATEKALSAVTPSTRSQYFEAIGEADES